ncbi:MAG: HlyD family type I secretion periplasmic adaptor subunit [Geminicoccaceae bacterium]|nr:MAG: HlyD family type I secretion periplasmic adaptor subunit [Geminicoccaceae bacterium]
MSRPVSLESAAEGAAARRLLATFASESTAIAEAPPPRTARLVVWLIAGLLFATVALAGFVPIERVVVARGRVVAESPPIVVQPLETAVLRTLEVREGDVVPAGGLLATLDPTFPAADAGQLARRLAALAVEVARLEAEIAEREPELDPADPDAALQLLVHRQRIAERRATLARYDERIRASEAGLARLTGDIAHLRTRLELSSEIERMRIQLEDNRTGSRLSRLVATDARVEVARNLAAAEAAAAAARHELEALRAERDTFLRQWSARLAEELAERRVELDRTREELVKAERRRELVELRAPRAAVVLEVARLAPGAVLRSGERLATLVPAEAPLEVEVEIAAADQAYVEPGQPVRLKLDAFRHLRHGTVRGVVRTVSADAFTRHRDERPTPTAVYRARVAITAVELRDLPQGFRLVPGTPLTAEILVGSRSLLGYFLEGALGALGEGLREP